MRTILENKFWIAFLIAFVSIFQPVSVYSINYIGINYNLNESLKTASVTGDNKSCTGEIVIPDTIEYGGNKYLVTEIGNDAFNGCDKITSVIVNEGVVRIGRQAFFGCTNLRTIQLPSTAIKYDWRSFCDCRSLESISIPEGTKVLTDAIFCGCGNLKTISIPESIESIENAAFQGTEKLASVTISSKLTSIAGNAFDPSWLRILIIDGEEIADFDVYKQLIANLTNTWFYINEGLYDEYSSAPGWSDYSLVLISAEMLQQTTLNLVANENRSSLFSELGNNSLHVGNLKIIGSINGYDIMAIRNKAVHIQYLDLSEANIIANDGGYEYYSGCNITADNVLGKHSFAGLKIRKIILPESLVSIDGDAFKDCIFLEEIVLPASLKNIGNNAFENCRILKDVDFPTYLETIGSYAFKDCKSLGPLLRIPNSVKTINYSTFENCNNIDTLYIGKDVTEIMGRSFNNCTNLSKITFNRKLLKIGEYAFNGCVRLFSAELPYTVEEIGNSAFASCSSLKSIKIPSLTRTIGSRAFYGCNNIENVYTYTVEPTDINQETFSCYTKAMLNVPKTSSDLYIYDTKWSQFLYVQEFDEPYDAFYLNGDVELTDETGRMSGEPDAEMFATSGFIIEGDAPQELSAIDLSHNGKNGASIIGSAGQVGGTAANLTAKSMNVNISVEGNRWYFFCFPFNVDRDSISCTSDYMFYSYDGNKRAADGTGWNKLAFDNTMLQKGQGYIFQSSKTGVLTIHVGSEYLTFTANNEKEVLHTYTSDNPANASWNFLGNPFISYYDIEDLAKEYDSPIIVWNGRGYDVWKPGDDDYQLKPFEAFFVQKEVGASHVEFLPDNRITYNKAQELKQLRTNRRAKLGTEINPERLLVNITLMDCDSVTDRTRIVYNDKAAMDYEIGCDAAKFQSEGVPQIFSLAGGVKYAINERPMGGDDIKLGYIAPKAGTYTLAVPRQDAEVEIYDNVAQAVVDFTFGDYMFETQAGTYNDRFVIRKTGGVTAVENGFRLDGLTVTTFDGGLDIEGSMKGKVSIYNEAGMLLAEPRQTGRLELGAGVYIVKVADKSVKIAVE